MPDRNFHSFKMRTPPLCPYSVGHSLPGRYVYPFFIICRTRINSNAAVSDSIRLHLFGDERAQDDVVGCCDERHLLVDERRSNFAGNLDSFRGPGRGKSYASDARKGANTHHQVCDQRRVRKPQVRSTRNTYRGREYIFLNICSPTLCVQRKCPPYDVITKKSSVCSCYLFFVGLILLLNFSIVWLCRW